MSFLFFEILFVLILSISSGFVCLQQLFLLLSETTLTAPLGAVMLCVCVCVGKCVFLLLFVLLFCKFHEPAVGGSQPTLSMLSVDLLVSPCFCVVPDGRNDDL